MRRCGWNGAHGYYVDDLIDGVSTTVETVPMFRKQTRHVSRCDSMTTEMAQRTTNPSHTGKADWIRRREAIRTALRLFTGADIVKLEGDTDWQ